jgi:hypothetical protein
VSHSTLLEIFTDEGVGTLITNHWFVIFNRTNMITGESELLD